MTVALAPVPDVDLDAATEQFTEIYRAYADRLYRFIWRRLDLSEADLAEDLTSETFIELWRRYMLAGRGADVAQPYGLLCTMARSQIGQHFVKRANRERALDFNDPANTPIVVTGHAYALERPDTVGLVGDLDGAMETMRGASKTWRDAHKASHGVRTMLQRADLVDDTRQSLRQQLAEADAREDATLEAFRKTCAEVARLRGELESMVGPNWRSAIGLPVNPEITAVKAGSYRNDRSVTHCPDGHLLDLNNTHFEEDGSRICRACKSAQYAARNPATGVVRTVSEEVLDKARAMLGDPACAHMSLAAIAKHVGTSSTTISNRLTAEVAARWSPGTVNPDTLKAARQMLTDPNGSLGIEAIATKLGVSSKTLRQHLPEEVAICRARALDSRVDAEALETARKLLTDPAGPISLEEIARACGIPSKMLGFRLPDEVAACQARKEERRKAVHQAARAMLRDPECALSLTAIANVLGVSTTHIRKILPDDVAAYRARQALAGAGR